MRKRVEHYVDRHSWSLALHLMTPYEEDRREKPYNLLRIALFKHSWFIRIPELIKPKTFWVDTSNESWNKDKQKPCGFMESVRKDYGFSINPDAIHFNYGIQPGSWSRNDPENSDHTKVFWWPWHPDIVRHDLLYPDGSVYHRNLYPRNGEKHIHWYEVFEEWPTLEEKQTLEKHLAVFVEIDHWTKDGKNQKARIRLVGEEREWRPKCTRWLPIFKTKRRVVDCWSDNELGPRAGSWKGGMLGWSCDWEEGEDMRDAFNRWYKKWDGN